MMSVGMVLPRSEITIEIEHRGRARLIDLSSQRSARIKLAPILMNQRRAIVRIFYSTDDSERLIAVFPIEPAQPKIDVLARVSGPRSRGRIVVEISVQVNDSLLAGKSVVLHAPVTARPRRSARQLALARKLGFARRVALAVGLVVVIAVALAIAAVVTSRSVRIRADVAAPINHPSEPAATSQLSPSQAPSQTQSQPPSQPKAAAEQQPVTPAEIVTVYFTPDDASLTAEAKQSLDQAFQSLEKHGFPSLEVHGHCALFGTEQGRDELSVARAKNVADYLRSLGYPGSSRIEASGYGATRPVTTDPNSQYLNRRVNIISG